MSQRAARTTGNRPGPRSRFTPETRSQLLAAIRAGNYVTVACRMSGIGERTFYDWRAHAMSIQKRVDEAEEAGKRVRLSVEEREYLEWWTDVQRAEDEAEVRLVTQWASAAAHDWRAARDLLARRHPNRWREQTATEVTGAGGGPIEVADRPTTTEDIADVLSALAELGVQLTPEATSDDGSPAD